MMCGHWRKDPQSNNHFCSFFVFHLWYCCKLGPATIAISQTLQIFIYRSMYTYIYTHLCQTNTRCCFQCFWVLKSTRKREKESPKKGKNRKISGIKFHITANSFFASLKKKKEKKESKMLLHICNYDKLPFPLCSSPIPDYSFGH